MGGGDRKRQRRAQGALERTLLGQEWPASVTLRAGLKGQARRGNMAGTSGHTLYLVLPVVWDKYKTLTQRSDQPKGMLP